jgi:hypothetical protein
MFPGKILCAFLIFALHAACPDHLIHYLIIIVIFCEEPTLWGIVKHFQSSPVSCHFIPSTCRWVFSSPPRSTTLWTCVLPLMWETKFETQLETSDSVGLKIIMLHEIFLKSFNRVLQLYFSDRSTMLGLCYSLLKIMRMKTRDLYSPFKFCTHFGISLSMCLYM